MNPILANILQSGGSTTTDWSSIQPEKISHLHEGEVLKSFSFLFSSFKASFFAVCASGEFPPWNFRQWNCTNQQTWDPKNVEFQLVKAAAVAAEAQHFHEAGQEEAEPEYRKRGGSGKRGEEKWQIYNSKGLERVLYCRKMSWFKQFSNLFFCMAEHFPRVAAPEVKKGKKLKAGKAKKSLESMNLDKHPSHQHISRVSNPCNPSLVTSALIVAEGFRCFVNQGFSWNWADGKSWKLVQNLAWRLVRHVGVGLSGFKFDNVIGTLLSRYLQDSSIVRQVKQQISKKQ